MGEISVKTGNNARNGGKNSLNRLIRCVCGKKIGPDPRNFNQRFSLGRNDLLIRTFPKSSGKSKLYDSYIRAIRWASDRIGNKGVIGFVTNGGYIDTNSADGLRKCLTDEFSSLYFFHLRGNQRTSGEKSRQEGGKIFGSGSRSPIVIAILVKNPAATQTGNIYFHDIGDYLTREEKLEKISEFVSINGIAKAHGWQSITPDAYNDWLNQRDDSFGDFISIGRKEKDTSLAIFGIYSMGVKTNRDDWVYNYSIRTVNDNVDVMIDTFNSEIDRLPECVGSISDWVIRDKSKIKWTSDILNILGKKNKQYKEGECFTVGLYRPFSKEWFYSNKTWNWSRHLVPRFIPEKGAHNLIIGLTGVGETKGFTCLITNISPNLHFIAGSQCFPLYIYDEDPNYHEGDGFLLGETGGKYIKRDAITDDGFCYFKDKYKNSRIEKEDVFYYVYGLLHSDEYRSSYADNLSKELPRIPCVKSVEDFFEYSKAGRNLADLHLNYETIEPYKATIDTGSLSYSQLGKDDFYVEKMKFAKKGEKGTVIYNNKIRIKNIPIEAYDYIVNGKSALEWVMEQQSVSTNNDSGIVNDANDWAIETMDNPRYPLELFLRIITVSLETQKIVNNLPKLDI
ncbi:type ISP restriction/modification enzyme [Yersinia intermedia]|uniref:type ISP restriction/modification enzyme n=1 Tax=Yersinia intermedia TaxID=631 RepID=UPI0021BD5E70|nr:type ISP restriction/modification enzyme [Yersinia intermedia]